MVRKKNKIILTLIIFSAVLPVFLFSQGYTNLSQTSDFSELPFIIARPNGELIAVWTDFGHYNAGGSLVYKIHTSNGWSNIKTIDTNSCGFAQLALDSSGNVHMAYWGGAGSYSREIYYRKYSAGSWSNRELVYYSPGLNSSFPRIQVEGNKVYVIWVHNYAKPMPCDIVFSEKTIGGSWLSNYQNVSRHKTSFSGHPTLTVRNGHIYAAWMDDNHSSSNWNIYFSDRLSGSWSSTQRLVPGSNQYWPSMVIDDSGNLHLIYSGNGGPVYYMKKTGSSWSSPQIISSATTSPSTLIFLKYAGGMLHGVWRQLEGNKNYIYYSYGTVNGNWGDPVKVSRGGYSEYPCVDVDKSGEVHIVYSDIGVGGKRDVFYTNLDQVTGYPVASFTATPSQGDPPLYVNFDASGSYDPDGKIISYSWDFGDGNSGNGLGVSHTYTKKGVHTAKLTIVDNDDQTSSCTQIITVGTPPVAVISATPTSGGSPLEVYFDGSESYDPDGNIVSYKWDFGDGTSGSGKSPIHTYTNLATRTAILTVTDDEGLEDQASIEINISTDPIARFSYSPKKGKPPLKVNFDASNSKPADKINGSITKYEWDFGDGKVGLGKTISHTFTTTGIFTVTLKIIDNQGLVGSTTAEVELYYKPVASFTWSPKKGKAPLKVSFDASNSSDEDGNIVVYKWDFGDGKMGWGVNTSHTYTKAGTFTIKLTVTDNTALTDSATNKIVIQAEPVASFTWSPKKGPAPLKVSFDASNSSDEDGNVVVYRWDFGDGKMGWGKKLSHTYEKAGTFTIKLKVTDNTALTDSATNKIVIQAEPVASFTCLPLEKIAPLDVSFNASNSSDEDGNIVVYKWNFGDGKIGWGETETHTYTNGGSFTVTLTLTDNDGLTGKTTQILEVIGKPFSPLNLTVKNIVNNGLYFTDYINLLEWQKNNKNTGKISPVKYLIYKRKKQSNQEFIYIGEVNSNTFKFEDLSLSSEEDLESYLYGLRAVDWYGRESDMVIADSGK
jgi:PKD repeat protein